jgi:predicted nucleic acid-binding protein
MQWDGFATCPVTQGALTRFLIRMGEPPAVVTSALRRLGARPNHRFWADDLPYGDISLEGVRGHQQVTDTYLVALAAARQTNLVTFDRALAAAHPETAVLLPA